MFIPVGCGCRAGVNSPALSVQPADGASVHAPRFTAQSAQESSTALANPSSQGLPQPVSSPLMARALLDQLSTPSVT